MTNRAKQLHQAFQDAWEEFGDDASTEFLIQIVCDRCDASYEAVVSAIVQGAELP